MRSGEVFASRTMETRFILSKYEKLESKTDVEVNFGRNQLRRGRAPIPPNLYHVKRRKKSSSSSSLQKKKNKSKDKPFKLLRHKKRQRYRLLQAKRNGNNSNSPQWFENHLWHSKRCLMSTLWNRKIAMINLQTSKKSFRHTIDNLTNNCTLHDSSYNQLISIRSKSLTIILDLLANFVAPFEQENMFSNKNFINGKNEFTLNFYYKEYYPFGFLCKVQCMFNMCIESELKSKSESKRQDRILWIWCHISCFEPLWQLLFEKIDILNRNKKNDDDLIRMTNKSMDFVRYQLRGPMSSLVLFGATNCFVPNVCNVSKEIERKECENQNEIEKENLIMTSAMYCNPNEYCARKCFIKQKTSKDICLKKTFVECGTPTMHPLFAMHKYHLNNLKYCNYFHESMDNDNNVNNDEKKNDDSKDTNNEWKMKNMLKRKFRFEIPFMMICKWNNGWDIIIPTKMTIKCNIIHLDLNLNSKMERAKLISKYENLNNINDLNNIKLRYDNIGRLFWQWLHFAGGKVIGYNEKIQTFYEKNKFGINDLLFPYHCIDSIISIHYWLKYIKLDKLINFYKKPKSKRKISQYPHLPFDFCCNFVQLFGKYQAMTEIEISSFIKRYLLNQPNDVTITSILFNIKNCNVLTMNKINWDQCLQSQVMPYFYKDWNTGNERHNYFIIRDIKVLRQINQLLISNISRNNNSSSNNSNSNSDSNNNNSTNSGDISSMIKSDWKSSVWDRALIAITIEMRNKGVPHVNDPVFVANGRNSNDENHIGYVINGGYSKQCGKGIGIAIVCVQPLINNIQQIQTSLSIGSYPQQPLRRDNCILMSVIM